MNLYKGFTQAHLETTFDARFVDEGVVVPYFGINGDPYREKLFSSDGKPLRWLGDGKPQIPYSLETIANGGPVAFLTEGESCAWALRVAFPRTPVLAVPGASSWKAEWRPLLAHFSIVYLSFDNDGAGQSLTDSVWPELPQARRVKLPDGKDTRDVLQLNGGIEVYERLLDEADYIAGVTARILISTKGKEVARVAA